MPRLALAGTLLIPITALVAGGCSAEFCDIVECTGGQGGQGGSGAGGSTTTTTGEGGSIDPGCIPSMLPAGAAIPATCGVFVDVDANGDGSQSSPYRTLELALDRAASPDAPNVVYVCGSAELTGTFEMEGGVSLFGGLECGSWTYDPASNKPRISGLPNAPALRVEGAGDSILEDFTIAAAAGQGDGQSSMGLLIHLATVSVARSTVSAANGANGAMGDPPDPFTMPAPSGALLNCGAVGGQGGAAMCGGANGGKGGDQSVSGQPGLPGLPMGLGGAGGQSSNCATDGDGEMGSSGDSGGPTSALDESDVGQIVSNWFVTTFAPDGLVGTPGGGGGGGYGTAACGGTGGGAGGCGGPGGGGGQTGGASLAIAVFDGTLNLGAAVDLTSGRGGDGGAGTVGADGQQGGASGTLIGGTGCVGGAGGPGGKGSGGAGGNGGLSALLYLQGSALVTGMVTTPTLGMGGDPGDGGDASAPGGAAGLACQRFDGVCTP